VTVKLYHNPRCSKSRQTLAMLTESGVETDVVLYLDTPPSADELEQLLEQLKLQPMQLMRQGESVYNELGLGDREMSRAEAIAVMIEHPQLIQRPIMVFQGAAVLGRPPANVQPLLDQAVRLQAKE
jgi:arsenate reductase